MIKNSIYIKSIIVTIITSLIAFSCRGTTETIALEKGEASVKVVLQGSYFNDELLLGTQASAGKENVKSAVEQR